MLIGLFQGTVCLLPPVKVCKVEATWACLPLDPRLIPLVVAPACLALLDPGLDPLGDGVCDAGAKVVVFEVLLLPITIFFARFLVLVLVVLLVEMLVEFSTLLLPFLPLKLFELLLMPRTFMSVALTSFSFGAPPAAVQFVALVLNLVESFGSFSNLDFTFGALLKMLCLFGLMFILLIIW